jgi:hypothetical protein
MVANLIHEIVIEPAEFDDSHKVRLFSSVAAGTAAESVSADKLDI